MLLVMAQATPFPVVRIIATIGVVASCVMAIWRGFAPGRVQKWMDPVRSILFGFFPGAVFLSMVFYANVVVGVILIAVLSAAFAAIVVHP